MSDMQFRALDPNHDKYFLTPVLPVGRIKDKVLCAKGKFRIEFQDRLDKNMRI